MYHILSVLPFITDSQIIEMFWHSHGASRDDVWESERAAQSLHNRATLQDQEAEINCLVEGTSLKGYLKVSIAQH